MDCFIIMPITTPDFLLDKYSGDEDHFKHVLEHLFIPAVEKAKMKPVPPIVEGADIIHAEIIKRIETAEFLLCDMSVLNPNVFFELGIRTAVNKPIALVKDDVTLKVPFDTSIINNHTYLSALNAWELDVEIEKLKKHLLKCKEKSPSENALWKYFSLSARAEPLKEDQGLEGKVDFLNSQFEALRQEIREDKTPKSSSRDYREQLLGGKLLNRISGIAKKQGIDIPVVEYGENHLKVYTHKPLPKKLENVFQRIAEDYNANLTCAIYRDLDSK